MAKIFVREETQFEEYYIPRNATVQTKTGLVKFYEGELISYDKVQELKACGNEVIEVDFDEQAWQ